MKYTRNQFSKIFGISMESLRYLEKTGIIQVSRNEENQYMEYTDDQMPMIHSIKMFQSAGISLERIVPLSKDDKVPQHSQFLLGCIHELEQKRKEIDSSIQYLNFIHDTYCEETRVLNRLMLRTEENWYYMVFDPKGKNSALIHECMKYLPHLSLMIVADTKELNNDELNVQLAFNLPLHVDACLPMIEVVRDSKELRKTSGGTYLYKVIFKENALELRREDIEDMLEYAKKHHYSLNQDLFGVIMGPDTVNGVKGFYLRLFLLLEE